MKQTPSSDPGPLTPAVLHVLLALSEAPRHGYAIMKSVDAAGGPTMGPGTVYGTLQRLEVGGLVREAPRRSDPRRRVYEITSAGSQALRIEADRIERIAELLRARRVLGER